MSPYVQQIWYYFIPFLIIGLGLTADALVHGTFKVKAEKRGNLKFLIGVFLSISSLGELVFFYLEQVTFFSYSLLLFIVFYGLIPLLSIVIGILFHLVLYYKFNRTNDMSSR
jgi:hypothetical protein